MLVINLVLKFLVFKKINAQAIYELLALYYDLLYLLFALNKSN